MADTIQALDRALELLIYLNKQGREVGITQIASDMGVYKSTVFRTLSTLEARGFVSRNPETEKYWLGSQLFVLGKSVENKMGIQEVIRPYARRLHQKYHEVVNVSILEHNPGDVYHSVIILKEMSDQQLLTVNPPVGSLSCWAFFMTSFVASSRCSSLCTRVSSISQRINLISDMFSSFLI